MRAFLSLTTDEFDGARSVGMLATIGHDGRTARTIAAEMEVRRILAETEPRDDTPQPHGAHPGCYDPTSRIYCAECMRPVMRAILAEALAAFIALPIEAE